MHVTIATTNGTGHSGNRTYGIRFQMVDTGTITGLRFYRGVGDFTTGRALHLWSDAGTILGTASTSGEVDAAGWLTVTLGTPVAVTAGTYYVASYNVPNSAAYAYTLSNPVSASASFTSPASYYQVGLGNHPTVALPGENHYADVIFQPTAVSPWPVALKSVPPGGTTSQILNKSSATDYAALAPMVMRHADQGDPAGRRIVQSAAEQIDTLVRVLFEKGAPRVTLLGGLASPLEPWLSPDVRRRLKPADGDAVSGAIILAKRSLCAP